MPVSSELLALREDVLVRYGFTRDRDGRARLQLIKEDRQEAQAIKLELQLSKWRDGIAHALEDCIKRHPSNRRIRAPGDRPVWASDGGNGSVVDESASD